MLFYWYFILHFNHCVGEKKITSDSTESRDNDTDQQNLPVTAMPIIDAFVTVRPQIIFFQHNYSDEICSTPTYVTNAIYPAQSFPNLSVTVSTFLTFWTQHFCTGINDYKNFLKVKNAVAILSIKI